MNKILRFSLISLLMMLCGTNLLAGSIDFSSLGLENSVQYSDPFDGGDFTVTFAGGANDGKYYNTGTAIRTYGEGTITISAKNGKSLTKIVMNFGDSNRPETADVVSTGTYDVETGIWTGSAESVVFTRPSGSGHWRLQSVEATVGEGGGETPVDPDPPQPSGETVTLDFDADYATLFPTLPGVSHGASGDTPASSDGDFTETTTSVAVDGVTVTVAPVESGNNPNRIWASSPRLRLYGSTLTIKSEKSFNKIVFSPFATNASLIAKSNSPSSGALEGPETQRGDVTWTGAAVKELTITIAGNTQIGKMVITLGEGGTDIVKVPVPTITGTAEFTDKTKVTITCADEDAAIYYTIDGSDPKTSSTVQNYSEPFELTETATVKAYVEDVEGNTSDVVEKTFTKKETPSGVEAANIAAFLALPDKTQNITLTLNNARVLAFGKNNVIVNDGTGGMDIYKLSGVTVKQGDILNGTVTGPRSDYNNVPELNTPTANTITVTESTITATKTTVAAIADAEIFTDLFKLENVEVVEDGGKYYIKDGDKQIQLYTNQLGIGSLTAGTFTIEGVVGTYKTDKQFWPTSMESTQPVEIEKAANIAALKALDKGKEAELTLTNAQVLYAWKSTNGNIQAYVRDASGAMCFDFRGANAAAGEKFETNKIVNGTIIISNSVYNGLPQASATAESNDSKLTFADGSEAVPVSATIATVPDYICDLVEIEIEEIVSDEAEKPKYYAKSGDAQIQIYNQFHVAAYEDLSAFVGPASKIKGIAVIYQTASMEEPVYEIYPVADGIEQVAAAEDDPELQAPEGWTKGISNGNLAGEDVKNYWSKEAPSTAIVGATIVDGAGKNGSRGIVVKSQDKVSQAWDTQFWIMVDEQLPAGTKIHVEFDCKADKAGSNGTQAHGEPGGYLHWAAIGNVAFTEEWQHFSADFEVAPEANNMQSIAFNLNDIAEANTYYFDNFGVWYQKPAPVAEWADLIVNGDMEGNDNQCFYVTEQGVGGPFPASFTPGIGKDGGQAIKVQTGDSPSTDWDSQFFIRLPYQLPAGTKFKLSFDHKASVEGGSDTQCHAEPGQYIHYACAGSPTSTTEWQTYTYEGTVPSQCDGSAGDGFDKIFQTIAFNLAKNGVATEFIFDNVKFEVPADVAKDLTPNPSGITNVYREVPVNGVRYNLEGIRVNENYKGIIIMNGRKYIVK